MIKKRRLAIALTAILGASAYSIVDAAPASPPNAFAHRRKSTGPVTLTVDATNAPRHLFHVEETMPVKPGPLTLWYPKWIPGEHAPSGPVVNVAGLVFEVNGKRIAWRRDEVDMYTFHLDIPKGANTLHVSLDFLSPSGTGSSAPAQATTPNLMDLEWNEVALYPKIRSTHHLIYHPSLRLPEGWKFGSALRVVGRSGNLVHFKPEPFNTLVDSPVIAGKYFKRIDLSPGTALAEHLDMVADYPAALAITKKEIKGFRDLVKQEKALFGSHHYRHYDALFTLSTHVVNSGLEHHQSSNDREGPESFIDPDHALLAATILPHEYTHSWNGKFRRPAGLWRPNFERPEKTRMLWAYEGLTEYLGDFVFPARVGLWTKQTTRSALAFTAANMDHRPGRAWRPLIDTAIAAQILYGASGAWANWRRGVDFYPEGALIWLAVDTRIRQLSNGRKSLSDFAKLFYGIDNGSMVTKTYTFKDLVAALSKVQAFDWTKFLRTRLERTQYHAPLEGITRGGWKLVYTNKPSHYQKVIESIHKISDRMFGIGLDISNKGTVGDVLWDGPAYKAGIGAGMKLVAVNGQQFTPAVLDQAISTAENGKSSLRMLVKNQNTYQTYDVDYNGGLKYPHLVRNKSKPDYLSKILSPLGS